MEDTTTQVEMLYKKAKDYAETNINLYKLQAIDNIAEITSSLASKALLVLIISTFLLFLNLGLSLYICSITDSQYLGFLIVSGFYFLTGISVFFMKKRLIEHPVSNSIILKFESKMEENINLNFNKDEKKIQ